MTSAPEKYLEVERKYDTDPGFDLPDLSGLPGVGSVTEPLTHELIASYFDTEDLRLARQGITLRRRRGGDDAGWHLKMPAGPDSKRELRAELGRPQIVPAKLASLVAAHTRGAPLRQVATLETRRSVVRLLGPDGTVLAEVADDTVTARLTTPAPGDGGAPTTWREIEVELGAGEAGLLKAAGRRLLGAGARPGSSASKLGRVLAPALAAQDGRSAPDAGSAAAAVVGYLDKHLRAILGYDPKARLAEHDAVHKMRVSVRRIRSALKSHRRVLDRSATDALQPELKWLADVLGEVRDLEVLRMRFTDHLAEIQDRSGPVPELSAEQSWMHALAKREKAAYKLLNAALTQPRYYRLLDALDTLVQEPPLAGHGADPAAEELPRTVKREWRRLAKAYAAIGSPADSGAEDREVARHDARKTAKRTRYAADLAAAALDGHAAWTAAQTAQHAKAVQEVLGGYQDGVIAMRHLRATAAQVIDPAERFVLGTLFGLEHCKATESLAQVEATWAAASPPSF